MPSLSLDWCLWEEGSILLRRADCLSDSGGLQAIVLRIHPFLPCLGTWDVGCGFWVFFGIHSLYVFWLRALQMGLSPGHRCGYHWDTSTSKSDLVLCAQSPLAPPACTRDGDPARWRGLRLPPCTYRFFLLAAHALPRLWLCVLRLLRLPSAGFLAAGPLSGSSCSDPTR